MRLWRAIKAAWREFWRVWKGQPVAVPVNHNPREQTRPADVPVVDYAYVGYDERGERTVIKGKGSKAAFLIARRMNRTAQLWHDGKLRDWWPR